MTPEQAPPPADFGAGRYRVVETLGRGSMGIVHRVHDTRRGIEVALKTILHATPEGLRTLKHEFRALAGLRHPHLVQLYELSVDDRAAFFTMELADGAPPAAWLHGPEGALDVARLRALAADLARGLAALHAAGRLHRDVKPTNVACACDGRVLLLDFGLAAIVGTRDAAAGHVVGTPVYAAPEQLWGGAVGPAADWYALGAVLHHLATGAPPWSGPAALVASRKLAGARAMRGALASILPDDLADLIVDLLEPQPEDRPAPARIRERLGIAAPRAWPARGGAFVGRRAELGALRTALGRTRAGVAAIVRITGPSGIGKSTLVERFLDDVAGEAAVLRARCHPHEHVRFNAVDGLVDDLSRLLADAEPEGPRVPHPAALQQIFPVLGRVRALRPVAAAPLPPDPVAVRRLAFATLRRLLLETSAARPMVAWIDDLQWADEDSHALLDHVLHAPGAPPLLLVVTERPDAPTPAWLALSPARPIETIVLGPLAEDEVTDLVVAALAADRRSPEVVEAIRTAAAGSPFVAAQLAADVDTLRGAAAAGALDAGTVLASRLAALGEPERDVLEVVALGARPLPWSQVLEAAGLPRAAELAVLGLEQDRMLRTVTTDEAHAIEPYHDRIREAVLVGLDPGRRRVRHGALARTLERAPDFDPDEVFVHYREAGDVEGALRHGEAAGDRAADATAFERAARRYGETLALVDATDRRLRLLEKLGEAQANAGHCGEAGETFERAAEIARATTVPADRTLRLRYRRAIEFLHGGRLDRGLAAVTDVLAGVGVAVPPSQWGRVATLVGQRARLAVRRPAAVDAGSRGAPGLRLELLGRLGLTVSMYDPLLADVIVTRHCLEALGARDAAQVAVGLATDAAKSAQIGGRTFRARSRRLFAHVDRLAPATAGGDPYWPAYLAGARVVALYEEGRWQACHAAARTTRALFSERCRGVSWEIATFDAYVLTTLAHMGRFAEAGAELPGVLGDAEARGDLYTAVGLRSSALSLVWLAEDRPADLVRELGAAMRRFPASERFGIQDYLHVIAAVQAALYVGDGLHAWEMLAREWPRARRAGFFALETPAAELRGLRARTALLRLTSEGHDPRRGTGRTLLATARRDARRIGRTHVVWAPAAAAMLEAGVAHATGADAPAAYARAAERYEGADMSAHAAACRECAETAGTVAPLTRALTGRP